MGSLSPEILIRLCRTHDENSIGTNISIKIYQKIVMAGGQRWSSCRPKFKYLVIKKLKIN